MERRRALVSVWEKRDLAEFIRSVTGFGYEIISTGGTAKFLEQHSIPVTAVSEVTGIPEIMDGRVKTLHPMIHGGILAVRDNKSHLADAKAHGIGFIDLVVVNLYPFRETIARPGVTLAEAIEQIDIGGPAMIRSAAKNWEHVAVVVDPDDYNSVSYGMTTNSGSFSRMARFGLAVKAFGYTRDYDRAIEAYLAFFAGRIR